MPPMTLRTAMLTAFFAVWAVVVLTKTFRGQPPSMDDWTALGIGLAAIVALFRNDKPPADQEGGGQ